MDIHTNRILTLLLQLLLLLLKHLLLLRGA
jgi:hypothetical protein